MTIRNGKELVDPLQEPFRIFLIRDVVQVHANHVESEPFGVPEFAIDRVGVEGVGLPHLQLVDGRAGDEIASDRPGTIHIPRIDPLDTPPVVHIGGRGSGYDCHCDYTHREHVSGLLRTTAFAVSL